MTASTAGALLGLVCALGVLLATSRVLAMRRAPLVQRIAPYVPMTPAVRELLAPRPNAIAVLLTALRQEAAPRLQPDDLTWAAAGGLAGVVAGLWAIAGGSPWPVLVILLGSGALAGTLGGRRYRAAAQHRRDEQMSRELPDVVELMAFAVAAGESPMAAVERVAAWSGGELGHLMEQAVLEMRTGVGSVDALRGFAVASRSAEVERFVDGLLVAMERGTPLADVLRAQAADARAAQRRTLLELAGRKDAVMIAPVVFLVLPAVILVALFPGLHGLHLVVP